MANERITDLPEVVNSDPSDIIYAVQGYVSPSNPGLSVQQTLQQVLNLSLSNTILNNAGDPNGSVAGKTYQLCQDTTNDILYICTTTGSASTAVWKTVVGNMTNGQLLIGSTGNSPVRATLTAGDNIIITNSAGGITIAAAGTAGFGWTEVTGTSQAMAVNTGYVANNGSLVTLSLPTTSAFGDVVAVTGKGAGGFSITQGSGQQIHLGSSATTLGAGGSLSSTNQWDSIKLVCIVANTIWTTDGAPQGIITVV